MTTYVKIQHTNGPTREMNVSFGDNVTGYQRCIGAAHRDPFAEPEDQTKVRLLGAAIMEVLDEAIPSPGKAGTEAARLSLMAKDEIEKAVMLGVKALYAIPRPAEAPAE